MAVFFKIILIQLNQYHDFDNHCSNPSTSQELVLENYSLLQQQLITFLFLVM